MPRVFLSRPRLIGGTIAGTIAIDVSTKAWAATAIHRSIGDGGPLSLVHTANSGLSFSGLSGHSWVVITLSAAVLVVIGRLFNRASGTWSSLAMALIFGGGLSNLLERLVNGGSVTDFIGVADWFVCNGADVAISVGVGLLIVQVCTGRKVLR